MNQIPLDIGTQVEIQYKALGKFNKTKKGEVRTVTSDEVAIRYFGTTFSKKWDELENITVLAGDNIISQGYHVGDTVTGIKNRPILRDVVATGKIYELNLQGVVLDNGSFFKYKQLSRT